MIVSFCYDLPLWTAEGKMSNERLIKALQALADEHDALTVKFAAMTSILGAVIEKHPVDEERVRAFCKTISALSRGQPEDEIFRVAMDLVRGLKGLH